MKKILSIVLIMALTLSMISFSFVMESAAAGDSVKIIVSDDTYVVNSSSMTTVSYGGEKELYTRTTKDTNEERKIYLKFDASDYLDKEIAAATLYIKSKPKTVSNVGNGDTNIFVTPVEDKTWTEADVTWVQKPDLAEESIGSFYYGLPTNAGGEGDKWCSVDITSYLTSQPDGIASLALTTEKLSNNRCYFYSKEYDEDSAPYIELTFKSAATPTPVPTATPEGGVAVTAKFPVTYDTYVVNSSGMTDKSYGTEKELYTRTTSGSNEERRTFLMFDCSKIVGAEIKSATLNIKTKPKMVSGVANGGTNILVHPVDSKIWTEADTTWVNQPSVTEDSIGSFYYGLHTDGGGNGDEWVSVDVTSYLNEQTDKIASLALLTENLTNNRCYFYSKEAGDEYQAYLNVTYIAFEGEEFTGTRRYDVDADSYVVNSSGMTNGNYGTENKIYARTTSNKNEARHAFMRVSCPELIGVQIDKAILHIKSYPEAAGNAQSSLDDTDVIFNALADKGWSETGITWNNQPTLVTGEVGRFFYKQEASQWYEIDVTEYLRSQPDRTMSFLINTAANTRCYFYSKEAKNEADRPYLEITNGFYKGEPTYTFKDSKGAASEYPVKGGSITYSMEINSRDADTDRAAVIGVIRDITTGTLKDVAMTQVLLPYGKPVPATCTIYNIEDYDMNKYRLETYAFYDAENIRPLGEVNQYNDPRTLDLKDGEISVISPAYRETVTEDTVRINILAPGSEKVTVTSVHAPDDTHDAEYMAVIGDNLIPNTDGFVAVDFPASEFPYGPVSVVIKGLRNGITTTHYLQLYNEAGAEYNMGMPDAPPQAAGMSLAFYDDFKVMPSISNTGKDTNGRTTTYSCHTPYYGDYGSATFENVDGDYNPYEQSDSFLKIKVRPYEEVEKVGDDVKYYGGLLSTYHPNKTGKSWTMGYFECRMFFPPGWGCWPSFWLLSTNRIDSSHDYTSEIDVVEGYMYEPDIPRINYPRWDFTGSSVTSTTQSVKGFSMTEHGLFDMASWWHTWGCKITEEYVYIYIDNQQVAKFTTDEETKGPMFLMMNLALGAGGGGKIDLSEYGYGADCYVDYVRVYIP